jgi:hypothetical protein
MAITKTTPARETSVSGNEDVVETATGLTLPEGWSFERWQRKGFQIGKERSATKWKIGDWWIYGERYDGRRYTAPDLFGMHYHTCENYAVVARAFGGSRRREAMSFAHHAEVASLPPDEADRLLDWCLADAETNGRPRSRSQLRDEARKVRSRLYANETQQTRSCSRFAGMSVGQVARELIGGLRSGEHTTRTDPDENPAIELDTSAPGPVPPPSCALSSPSPGPPYSLMWSLSPSRLSASFRRTNG